jgi:hypothetical protein
VVLGVLMSGGEMVHARKFESDYARVQGKRVSCFQKRLRESGNQDPYRKRENWIGKEK